MSMWISENLNFFLTVTNYTYDTQVFGELLASMCPLFPFYIYNPLYLTSFGTIPQNNLKDCFLRVRPQ